MTFSIFLDIFYPLNVRCFEKNGLFQQPRDFSPIITVAAEIVLTFGDSSPHDSPSVRFKPLCCHLWTTDKTKGTCRPANTYSNL